MSGCDLRVTPRVLGWERHLAWSLPSCISGCGIWGGSVSPWDIHLMFPCRFSLSGGSQVSCECSCFLAWLQFQVVASPAVVAQGHLAGGPHASQSSVPSLLQDDARSALVFGWGSLLSAITIQGPPGNGACSVGQSAALGLPGHPHLSHTYY